MLYQRRVTQIVIFSQERRHAWVKMSSQGESALIFCPHKNFSTSEDCEVHKPCGAQDHSEVVTGKESKVQSFSSQGEKVETDLREEDHRDEGKNISYLIKLISRLWPNLPIYRFGFF